MTPLGRREFLPSLARASAGAAALSSIPAWARHAIAKRDGPPIELIERNRWPEHWETTVEGLGHSWITRNDRFFVRTHFPVPPVDPATWRLEVSGLVGKPLTLSLDAIRALRQNEAVHTLECAGNGRGLFQLPSTSGTQWEYGAVGNASWGGVRLATLLDAAEVKPEAKHVWFEAADHATLPQAPPFLRSIPIEKAMADTLLAHRMNGEPLPSLHGAPLRAIVPGWYGMASTKWVTRVRLEAEPSDNHFMVKGYRYVEAGMDPTQAPPVREIKVKSLIMRPGDGGRCRSASCASRGSPGPAQRRASRRRLARRRQDLDARRLHGRERADGVALLGHRVRDQVTGAAHGDGARHRQRRRRPAARGRAERRRLRQQLDPPGVVPCRLDGSVSRRWRW